MITQNSIDLNRRNCLGLSPLHLAVQTNNADLIKAFVSLEKTDLNCRDDQGNSPLHFAVNLNNLQIVKILCSSHRLDKNLRDNDILIDFIFFMEFQISFLNNTALQKAKKYQFNEIVNFLHSCGCYE